MSTMARTAAAIALSATVYLALALLPAMSLPGGYASWREYLDDLPNLRGIDAMPVFAASKKALGGAGKQIRTVVARGYKLTDKQEG